MNKSYSFYCKDLNINKYNLLMDKAIALREFKNKLSLEICENPNQFIGFNNVFSFITAKRCRLEGCNNQDISNAIEDVYVSYQNKKDKFFSNLEVKIQDKIKYTYYKNNGKTYKKGDIREITKEFKSTNLTKVVKYITSYFSDEEGFYNFIYNENNFLNIKQSVLDFRKLVLFYLQKYGNRLINLCFSKRNRVLKTVFKNPIVFDSLTFRSCTEQRQQIISYNKHKGSIYNAIITLSGQKSKNGKINIPVKFSTRYHGKLQDYYKTPNTKKQVTVSYTIVFPLEKKGEVRIVLTKVVDNDRKVIGKQNYYGIDTNVKHNLFADKYGNNIDYDRKIFEDYVIFLKKCDEKLSKKTKKERKLNKKDKIKKAKWLVRIKDMLKRKSNELVKQAISKGFDHIVMEDLGVFGKSLVKNEELLGFKYSRLIKLLNLSDLKNIISGICRKHNVQFTLVQSAYTSITCDKCGYIHKDNRKTQEEFKCIECGHNENADTHSANMIEERVSYKVLRDRLLDNNRGIFTPKKVKRLTIKKVLEECYDIKQKGLTTCFV